MSNTELRHWGILGMKWGRRRYQNKDGSLTPEGKKRYAEEDMVDESHVKARAKSAKSMNDQDLQEAILRLQREKLYSDLTKPKVTKGREFVDKAINKLGDKTLEVAVNKLSDKVINKTFDKIFDSIASLGKKK